MIFLRETILSPRAHQSAVPVIHALHIRPAPVFCAVLSERKTIWKGESFESKQETNYSNHIGPFDSAPKEAANPLAVLRASDPRTDVADYVQLSAHGRLVHCF